MEKDNGALFKGAVIGGLLAFVTTSIAYNARHLNDNLIPKTKNVQQGYIAPNEIKIRCDDLDGNGKLETILSVGNKRYLLREVNGMPVISAYKVTPAKVVPKSE